MKKYAFAKLLIKVAKTTDIETFNLVLAAVDWEHFNGEIEPRIDWEKDNLISEEFEDFEEPELLDDVEGNSPLEVLLRQIKENPLSIKDSAESQKLIEEITRSIQKQKNGKPKVAAIL